MHKGTYILTRDGTATAVIVTRIMRGGLYLRPVGAKRSERSQWMPEHVARHALRPRTVREAADAFRQENRP